MTAFYHDILIQKCELERQVLQNTLSIAALLPDEFAYRITKQPGHMAVTAGEVIHIIKCLPVKATNKFVLHSLSLFEILPILLLPNHAS